MPTAFLVRKRAPSNADPAHQSASVCYNRIRMTLTSISIAGPRPVSRVTGPAPVVAWGRLNPRRGQKEIHAAERAAATHRSSRAISVSPTRRPPPHLLERRRFDPNPYDFASTEACREGQFLNLKLED